MVTVVTSGLRLPITVVTAGLPMAVTRTGPSPGAGGPAWTWK
jgi:hypothetical protein